MQLAEKMRRKNRRLEPLGSVGHVVKEGPNRELDNMREPGTTNKGLKFPDGAPANGSSPRRRQPPLWWTSAGGVSVFAGAAEFAPIRIDDGLASRYVTSPLACRTGVATLGVAVATHAGLSTTAGIGGIGFRR